MRWPFARQEDAAQAEKPARAPRPAPPRDATVPRDLYDDLMEKYHALAMTQSAPGPVAALYPAPPASPMDSLGPKTLAALKEMSVGMSSAAKRAQLDKTLAFAGTLNDEQLAHRVREGERVRMISIG